MGELLGAGGQGLLLRVLHSRQEWDSIESSKNLGEIIMIYTSHPLLKESSYTFEKVEYVHIRTTSIIDPSTRKFTSHYHQNR